MPETWPREINQHGIRYQLLEPLTPASARLHFEGPYEGGTTVWVAELLALGANPTETRHAFLDIGDTIAGHTPVQIGLEVDAIDEAVILRAIIMLRQYKRLRRGRMRFGESL